MRQSIMFIRLFTKLASVVGDNSCRTQMEHDCNYLLITTWCFEGLQILYGVMDMGTVKVNGNRHLEDSQHQEKITKVVSIVVHIKYCSMNLTIVIVSDQATKNLIYYLTDVSDNSFIIITLMKSSILSAIGPLVKLTGTLSLSNIFNETTHIKGNKHNIYYSHFGSVSQSYQKRWHNT